MSKPKVVILGGGYGGLVAAVQLQKQLKVREADITLVNQHDYHYETTWLHEVAAGSIHHDQLRFSIPSLLDRTKVHFIKDTVLAIHKDEKKIALKGQTIEYDYLVVALGFEPETFGIEGLEDHAFTISNVNNARKIKEHIEYQFSAYSGLDTEEPLTIVVGGAGFTGMEFLGELVNRLPAIAHNYDVPIDSVKLLCVEAGPTALPGFQEDLVQYAVDKLSSKGVEFLFNTAITACHAGGISVKTGEETKEIAANAVIWTAGVKGNSLAEKAGFAAVRGRVKIDDFLRAEGEECIFFVGDASGLFDKETEKLFPPTAQIAIQQGAWCADNIVRLIRNKEELQSFIFDYKGTVCSLGSEDGVGVVLGKPVTGSKASLMKKLVDNRTLYILGGMGLVLKKGKLRVL